MTLPTFIKRRSTSQDPLLCAHDAVLRDRLADFLRLQHPTNTAKEVARKARVPHRTVERWLSGLSSPRLEHFISLLKAYGPALLQAAMDDDSVQRMQRTGFDWVTNLQVAENRKNAEAELQRVADALTALVNARPNARQGEDE